MTYYFPSEKRIRRAKIKAVLWTLFISAIVFTILGYALHYGQTEGPHKEEIARLEEKITYYREHWTPIRETPVRPRIK